MSTSETNHPPTSECEKATYPASNKARFLVPILTGLGIGIFFFLFHEFLDQAWMESKHQNTQYVVHIIGSICSAFAAAIIVSVVIIKKAPLLLEIPLAETDCLQQFLSLSTKDQKLYATWFIAMRWVAVTFTGFMVFIVICIFGWLPAESEWPLIITTATLACLNLLYTVLLQRGRRISLLLMVQSYVDLVILVMLLHFSGGIENPFSIIMTFHVIIGGVLLSRGQCYGIAATAGLLYALMAFGEWSSVIEHYKLAMFPHVKGQVAHNTLYVLSWVSVQIMVLFVIAYFVTTLADRIRADKNKIEQQRLQFQRQILCATEEERKRVARELHDHTGQALTSLIAQLTAMAANPENALSCSTLVELRLQAEQALSEVHELSCSLRPSLLDDLGLLAALKKHCTGCSTRVGISVECEIIGIPDDWRFPGDVEVAVYRIVQEGITNSIRHSRAHSISVLLQRINDKLLVVIEDDGIGFDVKDWRGKCIQGDHLGLPGIEERAIMLNGTLRVESGPDSGTSLFVEIPLKEGAHA